MKYAIGLIAALALVAGPAAAQGTFGSQPRQTFNPGGATASSPSGAPSRPSSYGAPAASGGPSSRYQSPQRIYGAPEAPKAEGFKPYKPFTGSSTYASPYGSSKPAGAKDCERSVYTNACKP